MFFGFSWCEILPHLGWSTFTKKRKHQKDCIYNIYSKDPRNCPKENGFCLCNEGWMWMMWLVFTTTFRHNFTYKWNITYLDVFKVIVYFVPW